MIFVELNYLLQQMRKIFIIAHDITESNHQFLIMFYQ